MKRLVLLLAMGFLAFAFSSTCFAGGAVSVQWGDSSKPCCDDGGGKYKMKGGPHPMPLLMGIVPSISTGTIPTATSTMTHLGTCTFT